jgi:cysteine desulfurase
VSSERIYLDSVAGQPWLGASQILPAAAGLGWSLPSGVHFEASRTRALIDTSIDSLAKSWGVTPASIVAVHNLGNAFGLAAKSLTGNVRYSPANRIGLIDATKSVAPEAKPLTIDESGYLVAVEAADWTVAQAGNHEIGSVDDLGPLGGKLLVDASEWAGRMPRSPGGDVIVTRASSWGGPASVCFVVYTDREAPVTARERQRLSPEPTLTALAVSALEQVGDVAARAALHSAAIEQLASSVQHISGVTVHGDFERPRLPHLLSFSVQNIDSEALAIELDKRGFAVGAGSACLSETRQSSHVLNAMHVDSGGNIRISLPLQTTADQVEAFAAAVAPAIEACR